MKVETVCNGKVTLIITPETSLDEEILKSILQQKNEIVEIRGTAALVHKTISSGLLISSTESNIVDKNKDSEVNDSLT